MLSFSKPAHLLTGRQLRDGWQVVAPVKRASDATGGTFSTPYVVEKDGQRAFMKAMDLSKALLGNDLLKELQRFTDAIKFEGDLLSVCADKRMSRVVRLLHQGELELDHQNQDPLARRASTVFYFIFELAEGDLRHRMKADPSDAQKLTFMFSIAVAIQQLHQEDIAHQDLKPSNVGMFGERPKVFDLGRASRRGRYSPNDDWRFPGDPTYMPPEFAYGLVPAEYVDRRLGADLYALGSLLAFLFSLESATPLLLQSLPQHVRPTDWKGGDYKDAMPYLIDAHARVCTYLSSYFPEATRAELVEAYKQLTHPDPAVRGHPKARAAVGRPHGIDRYVSLFDRLSKRQDIASRVAQS
ncbi:MAG: protein kinase domain-containing protein [Aquabacterium sp.]